MSQDQRDWTAASIAHHPPLDSPTRSLDSPTNACGVETSFGSRRVWLTRQVRTCWGLCTIDLRAHSTAESEMLVLCEQPTLWKQYIQPLLIDVRCLGAVACDGSAPGTWRSAHSPAPRSAARSWCPAAALTRGRPGPRPRTRTRTARPGHTHEHI